MPRDSQSPVPKIFQARGPTHVPIHLLTGASIQPETAALADVNGEVLIVDLDLKLRSEHIHADISDVAVLCDGQSTTVAVAEATGVTILRDRNGRREVEHVGGHDGRATGVALFGGNGTSEWAVSADERGNVLRWNTSVHDSPIKQRLHRKSVSQLVATPLGDGRDGFLTGSDDRDVVLCALSTEEPVARLTAHAGWVEQVVPLIRGGRLWGIAVVDRVGLTIWDTETKLPIHRMPGKATSSVATIWHPATGTVVSFTTPEAVVLWAVRGTISIRQPARDVVRASAIGVDGRGRPFFLVAAEDAILFSDGQNEFADTGIRFTAPVVRWRQWSNLSGAIVILEDGSIWKAEW